jgi:hypothetical protein
MKISPIVLQNTRKGEEAMKKGGTIRPEQIRQAQRLLTELPVKDNRKHGKSCRNTGEGFSQSLQERLHATGTEHDAEERGHHYPSVPYGKISEAGK